MTDQNQAPERYSPAMLFSTQKPATMHKEPHGEFVTYVAYAELAKQRDELAAERYRLAFAICGGEDVPGLLAASTIEELERICRDNTSRNSATIDALMNAEAERDELAAENEYLKERFRIATERAIKAEAERDEALAASAAREIAMRDRAAKILDDRFPVAAKLIRALPISPDGQQALADMLADAWWKGWLAREYGISVQDNPHRKAKLATSISARAKAFIQGSF